jgi:hypothetical protein
MVDVFHFQVWNIAEGRYWIPPFKATRDFIRKSYGKAIPGTREDVVASNLDEEGRYVRQDRLRDGLPKTKERPT